MHSIRAALAGALLLVGTAAAAGETYSLVARIPGPDGGWDLTSVDPGAHRLYVARADSVMAVDLATGRVTPALVPLQRGHGVLAIPGTDRVIASSGNADTATLFDGATGTVIAVIPTGKKPDAIVYDPATRTVWMMNPGSGDASVIDPASAKVVATVPIGGSLELGAADGEGRLFVNVEDKNEVAVIDTKARKLLSRFALAGCDGPTGLAYAAKVKLILSACANGVAKLSTPEGRDAGSVKIGLRPDGAAYDEKRQLALVPSGADGTLSLIRLSPAPELVSTVRTQPGARTIALDPETGIAYLPSAEFAPATDGARPRPVPGTFTVLVVKPGA